MTNDTTGGPVSNFIWKQSLSNYNSNAGVDTCSRHFESHQKFIRAAVCKIIADEPDTVIIVNMEIGVV